MRLPAARTSEDVKVRQRPTPFSYWPAGESKRREKLQSTLFASDPWFLIRGKLERLTNAAAKSQAFAYLNQAKDFFSAATNSEVSAAKPLLLYYSFLNLGKCFVVSKNGAPLVGRIVHGLSEHLPTTPGAIHGSVSINVTNLQDSAFVKFATALGETLPLAVAPAQTVSVRSQDFLAQILVGHRVFCQSENLKERFVSVESIDYRNDSGAKHLWVRIRLFADDLSRLGYKHKEIAAALGRAGVWRNVACDLKREDRRLVEIQQDTQLSYHQRPLEKLNALSATVRPALWRSVTSYPPYRKYYVHLSTASQTVVHQILSIYIATFFFGSITRYKPEHFAEILRSALGPFVYEFFANQPTQFLYLLASEFVEQEVARAAIT